jgi:hypothetical protein
LGAESTRINNAGTNSARLSYDGNSGSTMSTNNDDFGKTWGVPWEVRLTIQGAARYEVEGTDQTFSSGRPKIDVVFYTAIGREICRRTGMSLTSKAGREYQVCRREPERTAAPPRQPSLSAADVFGD